MAGRHACRAAGRDRRLDRGLIAMFDNALFFDQPFRHFLCFDSFAPAMIAEMRRTVRGPIPWGVRIGSFYETRRLDLREHLQSAGLCPAFISDRFLTTMASRLVELFSEPLSSDVQVLGHRMLPGQSIGVHNDNPGLGFENYRVIVQLTTRHREEHGGALNLHLADDGSTIFRQIRPCYNMSFGFETGALSYHSVDCVTSRNRDALLFNFWHVGNSPAVEHAVWQALEGIWTQDDEANPDSAIAASRMAAKLLERWGCSNRLSAAAVIAALSTGAPPDNEHMVLREVIRRSAEPLVDTEPQGVEAALVVLAVWIARAPRRSFNRAAWRLARDQIQPFLSCLPEPARVAARQILFAPSASSVPAAANWTANAPDEARIQVRPQARL